MINREKAINLLNNIGKGQERYLYENVCASEFGFYLKSLYNSSYCIPVVKDWGNRYLVEDIIFKNKEEMKEVINYKYPPYFGALTKELADKLIKDLPNLYIDSRFELINKNGAGIGYIAR